MEEPRDKEARIGAGLMPGLAASILIALLSFYFRIPPQQVSTGIRDNIASNTRLTFAASEKLSPNP